MSIRVAYVEEPPFYWTADDGSASGADVELARVVLAAVGEPSVEFVPTSFEELLSGVHSGRWDMNVPIFVTPEREERVDFSVPVWSLGDGLIVRRGNPRALTSYTAVSADAAARLGLIPGQVQFEAARVAGVSPQQIVTFSNQPDALDALLAGTIDAFAATAVGNSEVVATGQTLEAVPFVQPGVTGSAVGAFSFAKENDLLRQSVNRGLRRYLGSRDHRDRMATFGLTSAEIDPVL